MANITITKEITQPEEMIDYFADRLGYAEVLSNPAFDDDPTQPPTIPNPLNRLEYVSDRFDVMVSEWFMQFAEKEAKQAAVTAAKAQVDTEREALKATIVTTTQ